MYLVADDVDQAVDDLRWSWSQSKRIGWAIDQGVPHHKRRPGREREAVSASLRHARLVAERQALASIIPQDPGFAFRRAEGRVRQLESALVDLERAEGTRALRGTRVGAAAVALNEATEERRRLMARAERAGGRERRQLRRQADAAAVREAPLRAAFEKLAAVARDRLGSELPEAKAEASELKGRHDAARRLGMAHPEATQRLAHLDRQIADAAYRLDVDRQALDGITTFRPHEHNLDRTAPRLDRVLDHGIDL